MSLANGKSVSTSSCSWVSGSGITDYPYKAEIDFTGITANDIPFVSISPTDMGKAQKCGLYPVCESLNGKIRVFCRTAPTEHFTLRLWRIPTNGA